MLIPFVYDTSQLYYSWLSPLAEKNDFKLAHIKNNQVFGIIVGQLIDISSSYIFHFEEVHIVKFVNN